MHFKSLLLLRGRACGWEPGAAVVRWPREGGGAVPREGAELGKHLERKSIGLGKGLNVSVNDKEASRMTN